MDRSADHDAAAAPAAPAVAAPAPAAVPAIGNAALTRMATGLGSGRSAASFALRLGAGNAAVARLLQRDELPPGGVPGGGMPGGTPDPQAADEALRLNGLDMPGLLAGLDSKGRDWVSANRVPLVKTPGVGPQRMAIAVEAVMSGREASDERLAVMMGEMQAMGLPDDQQEVVARFCGAFGLRAPAILDRYVAGAAALKAEWATLKGPDRARRLGELAAASLAEAGVPKPLAIRVEPIAEGGLWDREAWAIIVADRIGNLRDEPEMFARAAATVYHEARHGEQDFTILRALAGRLGKNPGAIAAAYKAPPEIVDAAIGSPIAADDPLARKADAWLASSNAGEAVPYEDRAHERDAHGTGSTVADRVRGGTPPDRSSQLRDRGSAPTVPELTN